MGHLLEKAKRIACEINELNELSPASNADVIRFRKAMYNPEPGGAFTFEGWQADAAAVHAQTEDKDTRIKALIDQRRNTNGR